MYAHKSEEHIYLSRESRTLSHHAPHQSSLISLLSGALRGACKWWQVSKHKMGVRHQSPLQAGFFLLDFPSDVSVGKAPRLL